MKNIDQNLITKARKIRLLLTDCDGVLTDAGVYYSASGEEMKRFSLRDGMGVERLKNLIDVETGIITGEKSVIVYKRSKKLNIKEYHPGSHNKLAVLEELLLRRNFKPEEIAYIGDDTNDIEAMQLAGLTACPADAFPYVKEVVDIILDNKGGHGAFRDFAEIIISCQLNNS